MTAGTLAEYYKEVIMNWTDFLASSRFFPSSHVDSVSVVDSQDLPCGTWYLLRADGALTQVMLDSHGTECLGSPEAGAWAYQKATGLPAQHSRSLGMEQTNASIVVDGAIVKWYRNLEPGLNPDVEIHRAISHQAPLAPLLGTVDRCVEGTETTVAIVQGLVEGTDGFELAQKATDFSTQMHSFGEALHQIHHALAEAFGTDTIDGAATLLSRIPQDPSVQDFVSPARALFSSLGQIPVQRIHGDLHLGQALYSERSHQWTIIDFEGEPDRPLTQRRAMGSVVQDLAGVLRSLDYAGRASTSEGEDFLAGYADTVRPDLLRAYLVDKALYELVYETHHRPDWSHIPRNALISLLNL